MMIHWSTAIALIATVGTAAFAVLEPSTGSDYDRGYVMLFRVIGAAMLILSVWLVYFIAW